jgi:hypothetical protein
MSRTQVLDDLLAAGNTRETIVEVAKSIIRELEREKVAKTKARATQMPPNWGLSVDEVQFARSVGWDDARIFDQSVRFRDYCRAHGKTYIDWCAAWRNWVTSPIQGKNGTTANVVDLRLQRKQRMTDAIEQLAMFAATAPAPVRSD